MRSLLFVCLGLVCAQRAMPMGIVRGDLVSWQGSATAGELTIRVAEDRLFRCAYDGKTYFERERQRISVLNARAGDKIDMISDVRQTQTGCYAMVVHVIDASLPQPPPRRIRPQRSVTDNIMPRGNLAFAGVVLRVDPASMVVRTRQQRQKMILLRDDTRYLSSGSIVSAADVRPNLRVFIRGGKNLDDEIEAYQVVWGEILLPR